jgi:hypothetical protein
VLYSLLALNKAACLVANLVFLVDSIDAVRTSQQQDATGSARDSSDDRDPGALVLALAHRPLPLAQYRALTRAVPKPDYTGDAAKLEIFTQQVQNLVKSKRMHVLAPLNTHALASYLSAISSELELSELSHYRGASSSKSTHPVSLLRVLTASLFFCSHCARSHGVSSWVCFPRRCSRRAASMPSAALCRGSR